MLGNTFWKFYFLSIFIHLRWESSLIGRLWCTSTVFYFNLTYICLKNEINFFLLQANNYISKYDEDVQV